MSFVYARDFIHALNIYDDLKRCVVSFCVTYIKKAISAMIFARHCSCCARKDSTVYEMMVSFCKSSVLEAANSICPVIYSKFTESTGL